ncbi:MAG: PilZ domain-containing protein [Nitrospira sp.]|nr:PilZ domain-containing protein [Nitrospira sp.]
MSQHFRLRTYQRTTACGAGYYLSEDFLGKGVVRDISPGGWRMQGDHHVTVGMRLSLRMGHPEDEVPLNIEEATVQWVSGKDFGVKITKIRRSATRRLERLVSRQWQPDSHVQG